MLHIGILFIRLCRLPTQNESYLHKTTQIQGKPTLVSFYHLEYQMFSFNIPCLKKIFSLAKKIFSHEKILILTCRAMLKYLSDGSEWPKIRGDLGKNR